MNETFKTVGLYEATKSAGVDYEKDANALYEFLMEPLTYPCNSHLKEVTIPTMIRYQFYVPHVIKALSFMVQEEMMTQESAKALETAIEESGASEVEVEHTYEMRTTVKGCNW